MKHIREIIEEYMRDKGYPMKKDNTEEYERLKAMTAILKKKLMLMMIKEWNGKDFTDLDSLSGMADDIINVISEMGESDLSDE